MPISLVQGRRVLLPPCGLPLLCFQVNYTTYRMKLQGFVRGIIVFHGADNFAALMAITAYFAEKQEMGGKRFCFPSIFSTCSDALFLDSHYISLSDNSSSFRGFRWCARWESNRESVVLSRFIVLSVNPCIYCTIFQDVK